MQKHLIRVISAMVATIVVMVLHELPKTIMYYKLEKETSKKFLKQAIRIHHYIDPVGFILCVTTYAGFSKPYMYHINDKKINKGLAITGFLSLLFMFFGSIAVLRFVFLIDSTFQYSVELGVLKEFLIHLFFNISFISFGMFVVNLFPIATFDMGNLVAGNSPVKLFELLKKDYLMKVIVLFICMFGIISSVGTIVISLLLG